MAMIEVQVEERTGVGSSEAQRVRRSGYVLGVIYADGKGARGLKIPVQEYRRQVAGRGQTQLFKLKSASKDLDGMMALVKSTQLEPVKDIVLHVDFLALHEGHKIVVTVPLDVTGVSEAVKSGEAILNQTLYDLEVECLPTEIPEFLTIDITGLTLGHSLHARDIKLPAGAVLKSDPGLTVVTLLTKQEEEIPVAAAAATPEAGAAAGAAAPAAGAPGAAAAAPAAGAADAKDSKDKGKK